MGGQVSTPRSKDKEYEGALKYFDSVELEKWKKRFAEISHGSPSKKKRDGFNEQQLSDYTKCVLPCPLQKNLMSIFAKIVTFISSNSGGDVHNSGSFIEWEPFIIGISRLIKAGIDERARMLLILCGSSDGNATKEQLTEGMKALLHAYMLAESKSSEFESWKFVTVAAPDDLSNSVPAYFLSDLSFDDQHCASIDAITRWIGSHPVMVKIMDLVVYAAFHFEIKRDPDEITNIPWTIPRCESMDWSKVETLLTIPTLLLLNYHVPSDYRWQWKLLFSTTLYGESFSTLLKQIVGKGPTVMIIKDETGRIFGGYNSKSWELSSNFTGDETCFLFSLSPTLAIYPATGYNKNYCYLNINQQTLPNGLGFGGTVMVDDQPVHYFALWLDHDFGKGSSQGSSTTYNNPRMSSFSDFKIQELEVWAVEHQTDAVKKAKLAKSILDVDPEARAILEMTGKTRQSEGLRELPPPDEDEFP